MPHIRFDWGNGATGDHRTALKWVLYGWERERARDGPTYQGSQPQSYMKFSRPKRYPASQRWNLVIHRLMLKEDQTDTLAA